MPEQQREPDEQLVGGVPGPGGPDVQPDAAAGHENEVETVEEEVDVHGLGRDVTAGRHLAAAHVHRGQQPRTAAQGPPLDVEETVQRHAKQLFQEFTISQVSLARSDLARRAIGGVLDGTSFGDLYGGEPVRPPHTVPLKT